MSQELKSFVINLKSLDQEIESPVLVGAGDANGYSLKVMVSQQAACRLTPSTRLYLDWKHQNLGTKGYNVFSQTCADPAVFELNWPNAMLREGIVLCRLEMVDDVSISPSTNFSVHVLQNPNDGSDFIISNDYSDFQQAVIDLTTAKDEILDELDYQKKVSDNIANNATTAIKAAEDATTAAARVNAILSGTQLTVVGRDGVSVTSDVQGPQGETGPTPVRGTDYWTDEDVAAIHEYIDEQIKSAYVYADKKVQELSDAIIALTASEIDEADDAEEG